MFTTLRCKGWYRMLVSQAQVSFRHFTSKPWLHPGFSTTREDGDGLKDLCGNVNRSPPLPCCQRQQGSWKMFPSHSYQLQINNINTLIWAFVCQAAAFVETSNCHLHFMLWVFEWCSSSRERLQKEPHFECWIKLGYRESKLRKKFAEMDVQV